MAQNKYVLVNSVEGIPDKLIQQSMAETIKGYSKPTLSRAVLAPTFIASKPRYLGIFDGKWNLAYMIYQRHG
ncbi:MAG: hypothetical protein NTY48_06180, partial [Candidatus Diapherotrites archaeon]|nr:hypothetical protein [Candidatus Diapherotrites archaeon]